MKYASGEKPRIGDVVECVVPVWRVMLNQIFEVRTTGAECLFLSDGSYGTYMINAKRFVFIGRID